MMRKMTIGMKLLLAFGSLLALFIGVSLLSRHNMSTAEKGALLVARGAVPEMSIAASVQHSAQRVMYEMQGYSYGFDENRYDKARLALEELQKRLDQAEVLGTKLPALAELQEETARAMEAVARYRDDVEETHRTVNSILEARRLGEQAKKVFLENVRKYLDSRQNEIQELLGQGIFSEELQRYVQQNQGMNLALDMTNAMLVANFEGQATHNPLLLEEGMGEFDKINQLLQTLREGTRKEENRNRIDVIIKAEKDYKASMLRILKDWKALDALEKRRRKEEEEVLRAAASVVAQGKSFALDSAENAVTALDRTVSVLLGAMVFAIIAGVSISLLMTRSITVPLSSVVGLLSKLSQGKLGEEVPDKLLSRGDELGTLGRAMRELGESLRQQIGEMKEMASALASSAYEISASVAEVTAGAEETSAAVMQTTSTMEEVRTTAEVTSTKSRDVAEIARDGLDMVETGKNATESLFEGMQQVGEHMSSIAETIIRLSEQTQEVGDITGTVEDLAEQSNLLAVNAAVEAAKAGEQGRGFSVVAQEIKSLAEQSKQSAREVQRILRDIQKATSAAVMAIEQGSKAVDQSSRDVVPSRNSIQSITQRFGESAQHAAQIASANGELLTGIDQVAQAMESIRAAGDQNVRGMKDLNTASSNLKKMGQQLTQLVNRYVL